MLASCMLVMRPCTLLKLVVVMPSAPLVSIVPAELFKPAVAVMLAVCALAMMPLVLFSAAVLTVTAPLV